MNVRRRALASHRPTGVRSNRPACSALSMRRPLPLVAVLGLLAAPVIGSAASPDDHPEFVIDQGAELTPHYRCEAGASPGITACRTAMELTTPRGAGVGIRQRGHTDKGHLEVSYNQYRFHATIRFDADGPVAAEGSGHAEAAWTMGFRDGSELWGTIATSKIELSFDRG